MLEATETKGRRGNDDAGRHGEKRAGTMAKTTTLHVRHVDPKFVTSAYAQLALVESWQHGQGAKCALVRAATEEEAQKAFHALLPVCNNRFLSVEWAQHDAQKLRE
ncbi:hypothetical protein PsorP6_011034 [Peronosclerospora sorghi]|uniref:Uncharacterized protein n=1 Tax=Peronosclerospora sorghi TaxID=230839 RepID=A0ACC0VXI5_9STRA|nr:hypothetical protein PsorP6_011034 [Peronosclerospora sorghi]